MRRRRRRRRRRRSSLLVLVLVLLLLVLRWKSASWATYFGAAEFDDERGEVPAILLKGDPQRAFAARVLGVGVRARLEE